MKQLILILLLSFAVFSVKAQSLKEEKRDIKKIKQYVHKVNKKIENYKTHYQYNSGYDVDSIFYQKNTSFFFNVYKDKPMDIKRMNSIYEYSDDKKTSIREVFIFKNKSMIYFIVYYYEYEKLQSQAEVFIMFSKNNTIKTYFRQNNEMILDDEFKQALFDHVNEEINYFNQLFAK